MPDAAAVGEARAGCSPPAAQTPAGGLRSRLPSGEVGRGRSRPTVRDLVPHTWCMAARGPRHHTKSMRRRILPK